MAGPYRARVTSALALALAVLAGCQDYNFKPVGQCLIQTGTKRVTLSNVASADVLFVVDDSGSMRAEQQALADNFNAFIGNLDQANAARQSAGLDPFEFRIAVTSTSMFWNQKTSNTCSSQCGGAAGQLVCCRGTTTPVRQPKACTSNAQCTVAGTACRTNCLPPSVGGAALFGEGYCCAADGTYPIGALSEVVPCSREGTACGTFERHYNFSTSCTHGAAAGADGWPYPQGEFMSVASTSTPNPRVLHFDEELYPDVPNPGATNRQGFTRSELIGFFSGNVKVGTCGSGLEQPFAAAQAAITKAVQGQQRDTWSRATPRTITWDLGTRTAASPAEWLGPADASKLVVVFVGDEDDCSPTAADPSGAVVWDDQDFTASGDSCALDASRAAPLGQKLQPVSKFVDFFTGLGRPVAAAFILPAAEPSCTLQTCSTGGVCCPVGGCATSQDGAQGRGVRLLDTAKSLASRGVEVIAGSICDQQFGVLLDDIANLVKPPAGLELPTQPAANEVTLLRVLNEGGDSRKVCGRPAPVGLTLVQARDGLDENGRHYDWWFTSDGNPGAPVSTSRFVYINPNGSCVANPGETYSADYVGRVPEGGCFPTSQVDADEMCRRTLGGSVGSWTCFSGMAGDVCQVPTVEAPGTCICGSRAQNCPNG